MEEALKQRDSDCIKIVLFGPESTGKTVLAKALAGHYQTLWVPEYSRILAEKKKMSNEFLTEDDVMTIAKGQMDLENELTQQVKNLLICDTDLLETKVYSESYYNGYCPKSLNKYAVQNSYNLYFLTNIDVPWETDGIRDKPNDRQEMFEVFQRTLIDHKKPYVLLSGTFQDRLKTAIEHIDKLLK
ncbi:nicotinate-nucleotide adenylyltransferase [Hanstruepera neustonica]|uniref:Nicotinate-nucleotide adenylyltransferase n=1 Tax=Hanstruepera neustonica TaxID=1445657 RepID=A0A2K1E441_9FLAO|nr:ATP-binding protein [Hanstruepera neustonica]PNQ75048.1 nicotinate-nucleotide adenylyltransferase [Hanstruepera neustonica]